MSYLLCVGALLLGALLDRWAHKRPPKPAERPPRRKLFEQQNERERLVIYEDGSAMLATNRGVGFLTTDTAPALETVSRVLDFVEQGAKGTPTPPGYCCPWMNTTRCDHEDP